MAANGGHAVGVYGTSWSPVLSRPREPAALWAGHSLTHACLVSSGSRLICGSFQVASPPLASGSERSVRSHKGPIYQACLKECSSWRNGTPDAPGASESL